MNAVRVAITGAGGFAASTHRPALTQLGATIVAASRRDIARAKEFTDAVTNPDGTPAVPYDDVARMLRETRPDVVIDASGSGGHVLNATTSLNAGVAYLGEKPIVMTRQEFLELRTLRQRTGVKIGGILQHYYLGVYQRVLEKIQNGSGSSSQKRPSRCAGKPNPNSSSWPSAISSAGSSSRRVSIARRKSSANTSPSPRR